jgi:plastocyanin
MIGVAVLAPACASPPNGSGFPEEVAPSSLRGQVRPKPAAQAPILVYLEPITALPRSSRVVATKAVALRRRKGLLQPGIVLTSVGQLVAFSNHDDVHHAIFSYSEPNAFELGTLAVGETQSITFDAPGPARFYCSLHESEHGWIFVGPSKYLTLVNAQGDYSLFGVPPGRYRLRTWSDAHSNFDREITLQPGELAWGEIRLDLETERSAE